MSYSILPHWWTFLDHWRGSCQDYFQTWRSIYYQRPLISPSLSDNDSAGETNGWPSSKPSTGRESDNRCVCVEGVARLCHSWRTLVVTWRKSQCLVQTQCFPLLLYYLYSALFLLISRIMCFDNSQSQAFDLLLPFINKSNILSWVDSHFFFPIDRTLPCIHLILPCMK